MLVAFIERHQPKIKAQNTGNRHQKKNKKPRESRAALPNSLLLCIIQLANFLLADVISHFFCPSSIKRCQAHCCGIIRQAYKSLAIVHSSSGRGESDRATRIFRCSPQENDLWKAVEVGHCCISLFAVITFVSGGFAAFFCINGRKS